MNLFWFADIVSGNGAFLTIILRGRAGYHFISSKPSRIIVLLKTKSTNYYKIKNKKREKKREERDKREEAPIT